jgi:alkylhydroperoxidase family enzyme
MRRQQLRETSAVAAPFFAYLDAALSDPVLDRRVVSLCAARIAQLLGHPELVEVLVDERVVEAVEDGAPAVLSAWPEHPGFGEHDRAALMVAEQFLLDPQGLSDDQVQPVRQNWGDRGLVALLVALGLIEQYLRLLVVLGDDRRAS